MFEIDTTRQNSHFPTNSYFRRETLSNEDFAAKLQQQLFNIKDDLLYGLITYGDGLEREFRPFSGFTRNKGIGYAFLAFLVSRALNLYRLPFTPDRVYSQLPWGDEINKNLSKLLNSLTPERVEQICDEIRALYKHTQKMLTQAGLDEVVLTRRIYDSDVRSGLSYDQNYATQIVRRKAKAQHFEEKTIRFEMDTLNSFGDDGGYSHYPVTLEFRVPATDILYCANFIASRDNKSGDYWIKHKYAVEPGEWVAINRNPNGIVEIPIEQIHINENYKDCYTRNWRRPDPQSEENLPIVLRDLAHVRRYHGYSGFGLKPKWSQRVRGALRGMLLGVIRGFRQGWFY